MTDQDLLPLLKVFPSQLADRALVVGDPARAAAAALFLQEVRMEGNHREYVTYTGFYRGRQVTVCSHGVGAAGASVCFAELLRGGVRILIRAGTCGALKESIDDGSLVIATGAIREDGTSDQLVPLAYPAVADSSVIQSLQASASELGIASVSGIVLTQAHLYPGLLPGTVDLWMRAGAAAIEMELAVLLVMASLAGAQAGGILTSDGNLARQKTAVTTDSYQPHRAVVQEGVNRMLHVSLEAVVKV